MNKKFLLYASGLAFISASCGNNQEAPKEVVVTDTVVKTETVVVQAPIDSAAIIAHYEAAHAKAKGTHQMPHKTHTQSKKQVTVDSHEPIEHHDVMTIAAPAATPAATETQTQSQTSVVVLHDVETVYYRPDEKASFPGGEKAFDQYIHKNLEYPADALNYGVEGTVYAVVFLDDLGKINKVEFSGKEIGFGLESETRRLLMSSPRWNPAKHNGVAVKSKFAIPITFDIKG
jgi:Gram-negative bacterial TonB protein C-terminal